MRCPHNMGTFFTIGRTRDDVQYKNYRCHRCGASLRFYINVPTKSPRGKWKPASIRLISTRAEDLTPINPQGGEG